MAVPRGAKDKEGECGMQTLPYIIGGAALVLVSLQLRTALAGKLKQGTPAPDLTPVLEDGIDLERPLLIYFYSRHCGHCQSMTPMIDKLSARFGNVLKLDIEKHPTVSRQCGARATPTVVLVRESCICKVLVGARSERELERLLV